MILHHQGFTLNKRTPENCTRLKFRQRSVKPCHPAHHCDSIWPSTGNITNLPTESLCRHHWITPCHKGCAFYSPLTLQAEHRKYAARRSKGREMAGAASAGDSCSQLHPPFRTVCVMLHWVSHIETTDKLKCLRITTARLWAISAWESWALSSVFIQSVYITMAWRRGVPTSPLRKQ